MLQHNKKNNIQKTFIDEPIVDHWGKHCYRYRIRCLSKISKPILDSREEDYDARIRRSRKRPQVEGVEVENEAGGVQTNVQLLYRFEFDWAPPNVCRCLERNRGWFIPEPDMNARVESNSIINKADGRKRGV